MSRTTPATAAAAASPCSTARLRLKPLTVAAALFGSGAVFVAQAQEAATPPPETVASSDGVVLENV